MLALCCNDTHAAACKVYCEHCKTNVLCIDAAVAAETAANIGCTGETLVDIAGNPLDELDRVQQHAYSYVSATQAHNEKLLGLPLSLQAKILLLHGSHQLREDRLTRVATSSLLQELLERLEGMSVAAVCDIAELSD